MFLWQTVHNPIQKTKKQKFNIIMFNGPFSEIISGYSYSNIGSNYHSSKNI